MTHRTPLLLLLTLIAATLTIPTTQPEAADPEPTQAPTTNWPTWRGPLDTGAAPTSTHPTEWSETKNIKWKVKLEGDASNSSPVIWGDKIFFQTAVDTGTKDDTPTPAPASMSRPGGRGV